MYALPYTQFKHRHHRLADMKKSQTISTRISKVNEELQKLTSLLQHEHEFFNKTKQVLQELVPDDEDSEDSISHYYEIQSHLAKSKGFETKIEVVSQFENDAQQDAAERTLVIDSRTADITVKKFHPVYTTVKKKKESSEKAKQSSKLKNSRSQNKFSLSTKPQLKKSNSKQLKKIQQYHINTNIKGLSKKLKTSQNMKTTSQNRLNLQSNLNESGMKMRIDLKKDSQMRITDQNLQRQLRHKSDQYFKAVMMMIRHSRIEAVEIEMREERNYQIQPIGITLTRVLANFFSQFFNQKLVLSDKCSDDELYEVVSRSDYLLKHMLKLPDIIKHDNTLCQSRVANFFSQKRQIDHIIYSNYKHAVTDALYICVDTLHSYIAFLINNNVVRETKRKLLPYQFNSQRSKGTGQQILERNLGSIGTREYDSDRKMKEKQGTIGECRSMNSKGLRRTNTQKFLSPKTKIYSKNYGLKER